MKNSKFSSCLQAPAANASAGLAADTGEPPARFIAHDELLVGLDPMKPLEAPNPIWFNTLCLLGFLVLFRLLGYIVLRVYHKPG